MKQMMLKQLVLTLAAISFLSACDKGERSFSILADESNFSQSPEFEIVPQKIDILWVIDNSGSMATSQSQLANNMNRFISRFQSLKYDFNMAVTTSDAVFGQFWGDDSTRLLRDGIPGETSSGVRIINKDTPNMSNVFITNVMQGIDGNGDERAFSSFQSVLTYGPNAGFRRAGAFLAIIILSDEDDFSATTDAYLGNNYNDSRLIPVANYKTFLDGLVGVGNHSVNTISILDEACRVQLADSFAGRIVGRRYNQLADLTGGVKTSLCGNFGDNLQLISDTIINQKLEVSFKLTREPQVSSIVVRVNGALIPQDAANGWTYNASTLTLTFHGTSVPPAGASISIAYDPVGPKN
ncbi:MAG: hypothetical protein KF681_02115 [Bdellovibrionaceae bacterium]|nr:hypothetical protein [Pseudobdellovibrionaceae bacterium]